MNAVELMSCGETDEGIIEALIGKLPDYGLAPFHVRRESDGFIFNRIWAAIKRECLMVVEEGVAPPADVDGMWNIFVRGGVPPFELMDRVGLDVVLDIEEHYASIRPGIPDGPRRLLRYHIEQGHLGAAMPSLASSAPRRLTARRRTPSVMLSRPASSCQSRRASTRTGPSSGRA